jgi:hypothetical protein
MTFTVFLSDELNHTGKFINLCEARQPAVYWDNNKAFGGCFFVSLSFAF